MRFVDDEDAVPVARRLELRDVAQLADVVNAGVGGGVDLADIEVDALGDLAADRALVARLGRRALHAVQRFGQDPGRGGLADTADAGEEVGVMDAIAFNRILERADDGILTDDVAEGLRPVFARQRLIGHVAWSLGGYGGENQCTFYRTLRRAQAVLCHTGEHLIAASFRT